MKKILFIALVSSVTLLGCFAPMMIQKGNTYSYTHKLVGENTDNSSVFNDGNIKVAFSFPSKELDFEIENLSANPVKIIWDEASFVQFGEGKKVFHKGVKYTDRNMSQVPTVIPSKTTYSDLVCPTDNVYWSEGYYSQYVSRPGSWETHDLWIKQDYNKLETEEMVMKLKGWKYSLLLPMEVNGVKKNYTFNFEIADIVKSAPPVTQ